MEWTSGNDLVQHPAQIRANSVQIPQGHAQFIFKYLQRQRFHILSVSQFSVLILKTRTIFFFFFFYHSFGVLSFILSLWASEKNLHQSSSRSSPFPGVSRRHICEKESASLKAQVINTERVQYSQFLYLANLFVQLRNKGSFDPMPTLPFSFAN